ncbi:MAG: sensor histidine kinase [Lachnospiraceae bacterium]|nr:sensor histidine kinase [Lachnospiraceae bacterium]
MIERIKRTVVNSTLASKIRYSYVLITVPLFLFMIICFFYIWEGNTQYAEMINSAVVASEFSLDFKKDFDYETYLLLVGNKSPEESKLDALLADANRVVDGLASLNGSQENAARLKSARKYLDNLATYIERIKQNMEEGNKYEDNIQIWENDVQIVTSLLRETIFQYIYYEIKDLEVARAEYQAFYMRLIRFTLVALAIITIVIIFLSYYIPQSITQPITRLSEVTDKVARGDLSVRSDVEAGGEVGVLSDSLNAMIDKINELLSQVTQEQARLRRAELELLQSQINPHFLYNTLDTIVWLAEGGDQAKVVSMVESLSNFFRTSLNQGKDIIPIKEELQHVRSYLSIQQVRYQDILEYEIDVPENLHRYMIPKITIQPLVENALYHGIKNKRRKGKIRILGEERDDCIVIRVEDDGLGMQEERLNEVNERLNGGAPESTEAYGLYNVNERIRLKFGDAYGIRLQSEFNEGTICEIRLPKEEIG